MSVHGAEHHLCDLVGLGGGGGGGAHETGISEAMLFFLMTSIANENEQEITSHYFLKLCSPQSALTALQNLIHTPTSLLNTPG